MSTAYFEEIPPEQYSLSVSCSPSNGGYVSPSSGTYDEGSTVTLTANPYSGYTFDHWGGSASGYSSSASLTMNSNKSVTAYFEEIPPEQYSLSVSVSPSNGGYVSPSGGTYEEGSSVTITATPYSGYTFDHWGGSASGYSSSTSVTMSSNKSVVAYFDELPPQRIETTMSSGAVDTRCFYYTMTLEAGQKVEGFTELTGTCTFGETWSDDWSFQVLGPGNESIHYWEGDYKTTYHHDFSFTASYAGEYTLKICHVSSCSKNLVIEITPAGWAYAGKD